MGDRLRVRARITVAVLPAAAAIFVLLAGAERAGAAANTACPAAFETIAVSDAVNAGYRVTPVVVDARGNGDGVVCRRPLGDGVLNSFPNATVDTIYYWLDNVTPR